MALADDTSSLWEELLQNEPKRMDYICYTFFFWAISVLISLQVVSAPYGRYTRSGWGVFLPARLAWVVQELPSFAVPLYIAFFTPCPRVGLWRNQVALGLFLLHYFQRYVHKFVLIVAAQTGSCRNCIIDPHAKTLLS